MTTLQITLPDALAQRARSDGLLSDSAIEQMLEEAMRRSSGRRLMAAARRTHAADIDPVSEEEIVAIVKAARTERRAHQGGPQGNQ